MEIHDVLIVGGGPTGLFGAFYAGMRELKAIVVEALGDLGGQVTVLYPEKYVYDSPGFPKILAKDLVKSLVDQDLYFKPAVRLGEKAVTLQQLSGGILQLETDRENIFFARNVLVAAGIGAFSPNKLSTPGVDVFEGRGVFYILREKALVRDKNLLIIGGGDTAVDWALNLKDWARNITLIHRRDQFRAHEASVKELYNSPVNVKTFYELKEVKGDGWVREATIYNNKSGQVETVPVDLVLINIGFKAELGPIKKWGLEMDEKGIAVDANMRTNIPGVYAAGDITSPQGGIKLNLLAVGFSQAATAINHIKKKLDPTAPTFEHSSNKTF